MIERARKYFVNAFGGKPEWIVRAPGRVNLIGEHVDYNEGLVLPIGINRSTILLAKVNSRRTPRIRVRSEAFDEEASFPVYDLRPSPEKPWWSYLAGVVGQFQLRIADRDVQGLTVPGLDIGIVSDLPMGSGLSSSAAIAMAIAELLDAILDTR